MVKRLSAGNPAFAFFAMVHVRSGRGFTMSASDPIMYVVSISSEGYLEADGPLGKTFPTGVR